MQTPTFLKKSNDQPGTSRMSSRGEVSLTHWSRNLSSLILITVAVDMTSYSNCSGRLERPKLSAANNTFDLAAEKICWDKGSVNLRSMF